MWSRISSILFLGNRGPPPPPPASVEIIGVRIPADGSAPHLLTLATTTTDGMHRGALLNHLPDLRPYWKAPKAWENRALKMVYIPEGGPISSQGGPYVIFYSPALCYQPQKHLIPRTVLPISVDGDIFIAQLQPHLWDENANATYEDIAPDFLSLLNNSSVRWEDGWDLDIHLFWKTYQEKQVSNGAVESAPLNVMLAGKTSI